MWKSSENESCWLLTRDSVWYKEQCDLCDWVWMSLSYWAIVGCLESATKRGIWEHISVVWCESVRRRWLLLRDMTAPLSLSWMWSTATAALRRHQTHLLLLPCTATILTAQDCAGVCCCSCFGTARAAVHCNDTIHLIILCSKVQGLL